jgi:cytochrome oxidase Cu insertion factor (SCO1/SenC/PrrC family)
MKALAAAGAGQRAQAYDALAESVAASPQDRLTVALREQGTALGKSPEQIEADVWKLRDAKAETAKPFELTSSRGGKPVRLSDYSGRVVLLAFWFPG